MDNFTGPTDLSWHRIHVRRLVTLFCHSPAPFSFVGEPRQIAAVEVGLKGEAWRLGPKMLMWVILAGTAR